MSTSSRVPENKPEMSPRSATPAQNVALSNPTAGSQGIDPSATAVRTLLLDNPEKKVVSLLKMDP